MQTPEFSAEDMDSVDKEMNSLLKECLVDSEDEEEFLDKADILMDVFAYLVDVGEIDDAPEDDDPEDMKQAWIARSIPKLRDAMRAALDDTDLA